jgi:hypothetical protein
LARASALRQEVTSCARDLARAARVRGVRFLVRDALEPGFLRLGGFDTVTAVHLLEHLDEGRSSRPPPTCSGWPFIG